MKKFLSMLLLIGAYVCPGQEIKAYVDKAGDVVISGTGTVIGGYHLEFDFDHPDLSNEWTGSRIRIDLVKDYRGEYNTSIVETFYFDGIAESEVKAQSAIQFLKIPARKSIMLNHVFERKRTFNAIDISIEGSDAMYLDQMAFVQRFTVDVTNLRLWGKNGGRGWCFSRDPGDGNGSWSDYCTGCYRKIRFYLQDGKSPKKFR